MLQRITRCLRLWHIYYPMHIERNLLARSRPMLVAEAVDVFAVVFGFEAMVAGGDGAFVNLVAACGVLDLRW